MIWNKRDKVVLILFGFLVLYSSVSLVNHYCFRTSALDLGAYTNALYDYIHFQWNDSTVFKQTRENLLADHFDIYLILLSPLSLLFGTYTLLIVQIVALVFGGYGIFRYFESKASGFLSLFAMLYFLSFFGVFSAISFDYHSNVVSACLIPWFFLFAHQRKRIPTLILFVFILIGKENISLWMFFICLAFIFEFRNDLSSMKLYAGLAFISLFYFLGVTQVVMPAISESNQFHHFKYSALGKNYGEAIAFLLRHPFDAVQLLFINHSEFSHANWIKAEMHLILILTGLPILFVKPKFLFMLIPIFAQKMFHDNPNVWGVYGQYNIEFAPILSLGVFEVVSQIRKKAQAKNVSYLILFLCIITTIRIMDYSVAYSDKAQVRFYKKEHYVRQFNIQKIRQQLNAIPSTAIVSAQSTFLPHLSYRDYCYQLPNILDAEYMVFSVSENPYPMTSRAFNLFVEEILSSKHWQIMVSDNDFYILKKI